MCKTKQTNKQAAKKGMDNILKMSQVHAMEGVIGRSQLHACSTEYLNLGEHLGAVVLLSGPCQGE